MEEQEPAEILEQEMIEEQKEDEYDEDAEIQEEYDELNPGAIPQPEEQRNVLTFLKDILEGDDRFKTANLTWEELGKPNFSTRFWLNLANACDKLFDMQLVAEYCKLKARITTDTSLSREGFIAQLAVTQRKLKEKKGISELAKFIGKR